jgi:hypothetical protein
MNKLKLLLSTQAVVLSSLAAVGCAGTLSPDEADALRVAHSTSGGGGPTTGTGGTTGSGGAGGGSGVDMCMTALVTAKACGLMTACHGGATPMAGMILDEAAVSMGYKNFVDKANTGTQTMDNTLGCEMGKYKLIDKANPMNSLIYRKVVMPQPCGGLMPVGPVLTATEQACVLSWINSVIAAP